MTMTLITTITVGAGGVSSIDITGIPQTGTDLILMASIRDSIGNFGNGLSLNINNLTASNYQWKLMQATGNGAATSVQNTSATTEQAIYYNAGGSTSNTFTNVQYYFPNYSITGKKIWNIESALENNATTGYLIRAIGQYNSSISGITSIKLTAGSAFVQNSTVSLYSITKGSGGATVA
jgi:hypothetical protein